MTDTYHDNSDTVVLSWSLNHEISTFIL